MADGDKRAVQEAAYRILNLSDEYWHALDASCTALDDDAWVGPIGRLFATTVHAERRELQTQLSNAVSIARTALQAAARQP